MLEHEQIVTLERGVGELLVVPRPKYKQQRIQEGYVDSRNTRLFRRRCFFYHGQIGKCCPGTLAENVISVFISNPQ